MEEQEIITAVANWSRREYGSGYYCGECVTTTGERADLLYVRRADSIHVIEAKSSAEDYEQGLKQLAKYQANYRWLAPPKDSYKAYGGGIASACSAKGCGLLLVSGKNRKTVKVIRNAKYRQGRFDNKWPRAFEKR